MLFTPAVSRVSAADAQAKADAIVSSFVPGTAAAVLLDSKVGSASGGTGVAFDARIAQAVTAAGVPVIVAGGLTPDNVAAAVAATGAWGVDTSSGVEASAGVKDASKVQQWLKAARQAHAALPQQQQQ